MCFLDYMYLNGRYFRNVGMVYYYDIFLDNLLYQFVGGEKKIILIYFKKIFYKFWQVFLIKYLSKFELGGNNLNLKEIICEKVIEGIILNGEMLN